MNVSTTTTSLFVSTISDQYNWLVDELVKVKSQYKNQEIGDWQFNHESDKLIEQMLTVKSQIANW